MATAEPASSSTLLVSLFLPVVVGAFAGFLSAELQDRLRRIKRWRGIAAALHADLDRIRGELGEPTDRWTDFSARGLGRGLPSIHEWTEGLIVEAGEISPDIVRHYMKLERELHNLAMNVEKLREAATEAQYYRGGKREAEKREGVQAAAVMPVAANLAAAQADAEMFHGGAVEMRRDAWVTMTSIDVVLKKYL